jgi:hypothetical protein
MNRLCGLEFETLKDLYEKENSELKRKLLAGMSWEQTKDQRKRVTEIASALHQKSNSAGSNPAESASNDIQGR